MICGTLYEMAKKFTKYFQLMKETFLITTVLDPRVKLRWIYANVINPKETVKRSRIRNNYKTHRLTWRSCLWETITGISLAMHQEHWMNFLLCSEDKFQYQMLFREVGS